MLETVLVKWLYQVDKAIVIVPDLGWDLVLLLSRLVLVGLKYKIVLILLVVVYFV